MKVLSMKWINNRLTVTNNKRISLTFYRFSTMMLKLKCETKRIIKSERIEYNETVENRKCDFTESLYFRPNGRRDGSAVPCAL